MKKLLKKLNTIARNKQVEAKQGSNSSRENVKLDVALQHHYENKPFSSLVGWFNSVTQRNSSSSRQTEGIEQSECGSSGHSFDDVLEAAGQNSVSSTSKDLAIEEYQIQLAMEMSAREDPEAVRIEEVKQISLGACPSDNALAEIVAYRYWKNNALSYDDKILDGFYDLYGIINESTSSFPSLVDLQGTPVSEGISWEAVLVNRAADSNLLKLEQKAMILSVKARSESLLYVGGELVQMLANLVSESMGGPVGDLDNLLRAWKSLNYSLRSTLGSMVLPLGSLTIGLARHRALLFKVLADSVGIPCRIVKGQQYFGSDDVAMNFVRIDNRREFIVDLMADPGMLIPSNVSGTYLDYEDLCSSPSPLSRDIDSSIIGTSSSGPFSSFGEPSEFGMLSQSTGSRKCPAGEDDPSYRTGDEVSKTSIDYCRSPCKVDKLQNEEIPARSHPFVHARYPSWTEGISPAPKHKMKLNDVSQYMIDAAAENPQLAQKLHNLLLESGVVAPPNLFTELYPSHSSSLADDTKPRIVDTSENKNSLESKGLRSQDDLPPLPCQGLRPKATRSVQAENLNPLEQTKFPYVQPDELKPVESSGIGSAQHSGEVSGHPCVSHLDVLPMKFQKNVPVAAAAAAAAAVASSMVVAVAKSSTDLNIELSVAAAATATAAAVVATTAAFGKHNEQLETSHSPSVTVGSFEQVDGMRSDRDTDSSGHYPHGGDCEEHHALDSISEEETVCDKLTGADCGKSDVSPLDEVADCEIASDEITLGERIGLGSYGEVYHGYWHGTEVAFKRFLEQDFSGESLEEFRHEVSIMKRLRHPNVVLFMGAVTRSPNLSIVTEFLPRGSLYRLIHRPNNQLDERRRLRMALDVARGMNYLHSCSPVIVHRDLKSPNLLVDRNWVVKVCDFGLSKMKHSTFLSSISNAGTAEWMAPEVLRNEPSNEKCDVYSFGVILWELCTMQQPWGGMNPMQVVGAVGFQHRRLDIPEDLDPAIAEIICKCWQTDPKLRPTFSEIMAALKSLQKPINSSSSKSI
ncbi:hypothetical protein Nepgr_018919 [Nepenthes gracilis]|uniref:non-specific serine/threonine protein kinase n=1 Tax=Nepenthes gracilis TaxID=150966 RepID=A0AAD3ST08_NEPGR|nr:hypothetical protein Nepgr_018919 [Nepenthes gracilis]